MLLTDRVNACVDGRTSPGSWPRQDGMDARLQDVCTVCIEAFRLLTIYLKPVLPALAAQVEAFLKVRPLDFCQCRTPCWARATRIGDYKHLMQRVDVKQLDALFEPPARPSPRRPLPRRTCPAARRSPPPSRLTTSPRSTCASRRSSTARRWKARPSCCA
jgi:methionyl-tRNA synthetase